MDNNEIDNASGLDDSGIEAVALRCVKICEEKKASNIVLFDVREHSILADYYLICCGNSQQHIRALADNMRRTLVDEGIKPRGQDGASTSQWIVLDYGVILVHVMTPEMRRHYCLEDLWDKRLIVFQGGEEMSAERPGTMVADSPEWDDGEEDFDEEDYDEEDYEDFVDEDEDDFDDEDDEDDDDFYDDEDEEEDVDEDMPVEKKHERLPGDITLDELFKNDDDDVPPPSRKK